MPTKEEKIEKLRKKLRAKLESMTSFVAVSPDGKIVAHGSTELKALKLLEKTLKKASR